MNQDFISRAEKVTSFNITTKDFLTLDYKCEIKHLFEKHFFSDVKIPSVDKVDKDQINHVITQLKSVSNDAFNNMHKYNLKGIGPGEVSLYCVVGSAVLGGGSSAGTDVMAACGDYEVKAAHISKDRVASDFLLGGNVVLTDLLIDLNNLRDEMGIGGCPSSIPKTVICEMREIAPVEMSKIENEFAERAGEYFSSHPTIFIDNHSIPRLGCIEAVKEVTPNDLRIQRVTKGTIKPEVKL